jgi:AAA domain
MTTLTLQQIARALGGEVVGVQVIAPGPGHSPGDRSLSVKLSASAPDGFVVHSFAGDDPLVCRDYVRKRSGLPPFKPNGKTKPARTITYDYRDASGEFRYRKTRRDYPDGSKDFYFEKPSRNGGPALLYGAERLADLGQGQPVWIVEGEQKVDRLRDLGASAVSGDSGAQSKWLPEHAELLRGLPVILWPDSDPPGERYVANAAAAIRAVNPDADVRVVRPFGPPDGKKGRDVCDWQGDAQEFAALAENAKPYSIPPASMLEGTQENPIKLLTYAEMVNLPPAEWLIDFVLPMRSKSVLFGLSDSFKSFLAIDMACSVSTSRSWHGHAVKLCKVIYLANEGAIGVGRKRIPAWMAYHEIPDEDRQNIFLVKVDTILPDEKSRATLLAAIRAIVEPGETFILIIDVLRGSMSGSESDDEAAHAWTNAAEALIEEGASILAVTHSPYGEDGRMRGHSHLWGSFDTRLLAEGDKARMTTILKVNRHKDRDSTGQWGFKLEVQNIPEHPGETSLVPRLDAEARAQNRRKGKGEPSMGTILKHQYLETYDRLADGVEKTTGLDGKPVIKVLTDVIRDELKSRGFLDKNDTPRGGLTRCSTTALSKAKRALLTEGTLVELDDLVWRP